MCKYLLPFCRLSSHFPEGVLGNTKLFNADYVLFFLLLVLLVSYLRNHSQILDHKNLLLFSSKNVIGLAPTIRSMIHFESMVLWC